VVQAGRELVLGIAAGEGQAGLVEDPRDVVAGGDLGDDRPQPAPRGHHPDRRSHRRLPDAALAGDDDELLVEGAQTSPSQ
jgi:hypothetical protein